MFTVPEILLQHLKWSLYVKIWKISTYAKKPLRWHLRFPIDVIDIMPIILRSCGQILCQSLMVLDFIFCLGKVDQWLSFVSRSISHQHFLVWFVEFVQTKFYLLECKTCPTLIDWPVTKHNSLCHFALLRRLVKYWAGCLKMVLSRGESYSLHPNSGMYSNIPITTLPPCCSP